MDNDDCFKDQYAYSYAMLTKWLKLKIERKGVADFFVKNNIRTIGIYGISGFGKMLFDDLKGTCVEVCFFIDRKYQDWMNGCHGIPVVGLTDIKSRINDVDKLVVTPVYEFNQILADLQKEGIAENKIISLSMVVTEAGIS